MERQCLHQIVLIENPLPRFLCGLSDSKKAGLDLRAQWVLPVLDAWLGGAPAATSTELTRP